MEEEQRKKEERERKKKEAEERLSKKGPNFVITKRSDAQKEGVSVIESFSERVVQPIRWFMFVVCMQYGILKCIFIVRVLWHMWVNLMF